MKNTPPKKIKKQTKGITHLPHHWNDMEHASSSCHSEDPETIRKVCVEYLRLSSPSTMDARDALVKQHPAIFQDGVIVAALHEAKEVFQQTLAEVQATYACINGVYEGLGLPSSFKGVQPAECRLDVAGVPKEEEPPYPSKDVMPPMGNRCPPASHGSPPFLSISSRRLSSTTTPTGGTLASACETLERDIYALFSQQMSTYLSVMDAAATTLSPTSRHTVRGRSHSAPLRSPALAPLPATWRRCAGREEGTTGRGGGFSKVAPCTKSTVDAMQTPPALESSFSSSVSNVSWYEIPEIVLEILSWLPAREILLHAEEVCRAWQYWLYVPEVSRAFWLGVVRREYPTLLLHHLRGLFEGGMKKKEDPPEEKGEEEGNDPLCTSDWRTVAMLGVSQEDGVEIDE